MRTPHNVTLYVHRLPCLFFLCSVFSFSPNTAILRLSTPVPVSQCTLDSFLPAQRSEVSAYQVTGCRVFSSVRSDRQTPPKS
jgi:hypothetical protein